jgi:hypothetical protein
MLTQLINYMKKETLCEGYRYYLYTGESSTLCVCVVFLKMLTCCENFTNSGTQCMPIAAKIIGDTDQLPNSFPISSRLNDPFDNK